MEQQNRVPPMHPGILRDEAAARNNSSSIFRPWETTASTEQKEPEKQPHAPPEHKLNLSPNATTGLPLQAACVISVPVSSCSPTITVSPPYSSPPLLHSPPSASSTPGNQSNDSAYHSDSSTPSPGAKPATPTKGTRLFSADVIRVLDHWYHQHFDHPYPTLHDVHDLAKKCSLRPDQVRKWLANKRNRSNNTLTYNGNVHPKSAKKMQQKSPKSDILSSPYPHPTTTQPPMSNPSFPWVQMPFNVHSYPYQHATIAPPPFLSTQLGGLTFGQQLQHQSYINQLVFAQPLQQKVEPFQL